MLLAQALFCAPGTLLLTSQANHLDMKPVESLNLTLENRPNALIFASHDHELVASLATGIIELTLEPLTLPSRGGVVPVRRALRRHARVALEALSLVNYSGSYDEYLERYKTAR